MFLNYIFVKPLAKVIKVYKFCVIQRLHEVVWYSLEYCGKADSNAQQVQCLNVGHQFTLKVIMLIRFTQLYGVEEMKISHIAHILAKDTKSFEYQ